ncbi:MAG: TIGR01212 family radical SAM protein [Lentisphaeria bacterium]|nr:TIGR01212 family radical SAM protein [Lentisphaeria bacterium]
MKRIRFFNDLLTEKYGVPLHRIPFDLGLSCPNRAGGAGPCAFCAADGARARHLDAGMDLAAQARAGRDYIRKRYCSDGPYLAYFQAYTNTFAPVPRLRELYSAALATADFKALVIATRPDCLPEECLDYLAELKERYELWLELGVQTANDATLRRIDRGHDFACVQDAVRLAHDRGIHCAAHLILGLPGETEKDHLRTADRIAELPFEAVKMHHLLILKGTPMARMLHEGQVHPLNEYEYASALAKFLRRLPDGMSVMRLSADAPRETVIAPKWWMKKGQFREMFLDFYGHGENPAAPFDFACRTGDGSYTFYHPGYRQHFHSLAGAGSESDKKYLEPCRIRERLKNGEALTVLEIGFGLGCNASALLRAVRETGRGSLRMVSLESDPAVLSAAALLPDCPEPDMINSLRRCGRYETEGFSLELVIGDARKCLPENIAADAVFLDGFSPESNPELWTEDFIGELKKRMKPDGLLATYSSAYPVCGALLKNGFLLYRSEPFGRKRGGLLAALAPQTGPDSLPEKDLLITTRSTAGTPYSDPGLVSSREEILRRHAEKITELRRTGMPKWFRK